MEFASCLARLRRGAGFPTAYRFYHGNGGRRHFPFTFVHYLRIERGLKLPKPQWLAGFLSALRLTPGEAGCREFFLAYMKGLLRTEEAFELVLAPLLSRRQDRAATMGAQALRWMKTAHARHLSPEQFQVLASDEAAYWCSEVLFNDGGSWSAPEIARILGLPEKAAARGLEKLTAAGMAKKTSKDRFRSRWPGKLYTFPGRLEGMKRHLDAIAGFWERMFKRRGAEVGERVELVRAEAGAMRGYLPALAEALDSANVCATHAKGEATGLFLIEARVRKLADF
ncbi:MAG: hypothetical protein AAB339_02790 [Elusimicrobiota bacterium]